MSSYQHKHHEQPDIEELAARCSFEQLSPNEQELVLQLLPSATAYEELRATILRSRQSLHSEAAMTPTKSAAPEVLHKALSEALQAKRQNSTQALLLRRMPLYQTILVSAACVLMAMLFIKPSAAPVAALPVIVRDTVQTIVYQDINRDSLAQLIADSIRSVLAFASPKETRQLVSSSRRSRQQYDSLVQRVSFNTAPPMLSEKSPNRFVGLANMPFVLEQKRGRSVAENPDASKVTFIIQQ